jgi:hypothetical protein
MLKVSLMIWRVELTIALPPGILKGKERQSWTSSCSLLNRSNRSYRLLQVEESKFLDSRDISFKKMIVSQKSKFLALEKSGSVEMRESVRSLSWRKFAKEKLCRKSGSRLRWGYKKLLEMRFVRYEWLCSLKWLLKYSERLNQKNKYEEE